MRNVIIAREVWDKIADLRSYLIIDLKLSEEAAMNRMDRMGDFLKALSNPSDYSLCRFKKWRLLGYRCVVFEKQWVFAYEIVKQGIIIRDMSNGALLK